jgi:lycopene beta-cyclase
VEYTLFSEKLLPKEEYEDAIKDYLSTKGITGYTLVDKEFGSIPMTSYPFWKHNSNNVIYIGSAGGWTKASTGYTFRNSDKLSKRLIHFLEKDINCRGFIYKKRFWLYDLLLLDILADKNYKGRDIFSAMFKNGKAALVFKFLDEETNLAEDLAVIWRCPKGLFIKALFKRLF